MVIMQVVLHKDFYPASVFNELAYKEKMNI